MGLLNFENEIRGKLYLKFNLKIDGDGDGDGDGNDTKKELIRELFPSFNNNQEIIGEYMRI